MNSFLSFIYSSYTRNSTVCLTRVVLEQLKSATQVSQGKFTKKLPQKMLLYFHKLIVYHPESLNCDVILETRNVTAGLSHLFLRMGPGPLELGKIALF